MEKCRKYIWGNNNTPKYPQFDERHKFIDSKSSMNPKTNKYKENHS